MSLARYLSKLGQLINSSGQVTPSALSTGAPSWDSSGKVTTTGSVVVADEYYTGAGVGGGASGSWQYKAGASGFIVGNTNGIERIRVDASGRVTKPYQTSFRASRSSGNVSFGNVVVFDSVGHNIGSAYNSTNGRFTAPVAGIYWFDFYGLNNGGSGTNCEVKFRANGSSVRDIRQIAAGPSNSTSLSGSMCIYMNVGDYLEVYLNAGGPLYSGGNEYTQFCGYYLG